MSSYRSSIPPAGTRSSMFGDATSDRYTATLRYLSSVAHAEAVEHPKVKAPATGAQFVRDVMVGGVVAAREDAVFKEILAAMSRNRISAVPVVDAEHKVIGVVSEADLLARVSGGVVHPKGHRLSGHGENKTKVHAATARELMTAPAVVTTPDTPIVDAARKAAANRVRRLPVVDDAGRLVGVVARGDLLKPFLREDDEIREEIVHNVLVGSFLLSSPGVDVQVSEGVVRLSGQIERKLVMVSLIQAVRAVAGVVDVDRSGLTYLIDDTNVPAPSTLPY